MKSEEATQVLGILAAGFHRETMEEATVDLWLEIIEPMDATLATKIALGWVKNQDRFPTISQFRHAYHSERRSVDREEGPRALVAIEEVGTGRKTPEWVQRWSRKNRHNCHFEDPRVRAAKGDWRLFPEQIAGEVVYRDDPRFTTGEAAELGMMPDDAWLTDDYHPPAKTS